MAQESDATVLWVTGGVVGLAVVGAVAWVHRPVAGTVVSVASSPGLGSSGTPTSSAQLTITDISVSGVG